MGHRSSKSAVANSSSSADDHWENSNNNSSNRITLPPLPDCTTINVQIQESPTIDIVSNHHQIEPSDSDSLNSLTGSNSLQNRQIIIKIQLAKMENNGNNDTETDVVTQSSLTTRQQKDDETSVISNAPFYQTATAANIESSNAAAPQFVNLTLNGNLIFADEGVNSQASLSSTSSNNSRTAGGSKYVNNNNKNSSTSSSSSTSSLDRQQHNAAHDLRIRLNALHIQEDWEQHPPNDSMPEYCEVLEESIGENKNVLPVRESRCSDAGLTDNVGCLNSRRKSKSVSMTRPSSTSSLVLSRRRCKDAIRRILDPATKLSSNKSKEQNNKKHSESFQAPPPPTFPQTSLATSAAMSSLPSTSTGRKGHRSIANADASASSASNNLMPIKITTVGATTTSATATTVNPNIVPTTIWTPSRNDLIIPITSPPQFVVVQCAPSSVLTLGRIDDNANAIRLTTSADMSTAAFNINSSENATTATMRPPAPTNLTRSISNGPIVHSQVDFVHCLVPDLDKIVNSSFYWGKIDRYEAERLLEGKPEGTFLLRDSAQEEYLFSVTFRKYGRSLHARIEQSGHKFGFDCHDPGVFTAPTVTGLLQHYKDPACVMFFEPMLTIPLHRKTVFSLQELARAVIVSNTTYDGVNELGLPLRVKSFLKEYHYKQKLRVKPCDEPFYSCT